MIAHEHYFTLREYKDTTVVDTVILRKLIAPANTELRPGGQGLTRQ